MDSKLFELMTCILPNQIQPIMFLSLATLLKHRFCYQLQLQLQRKSCWHKNTVFGLVTMFLLAKRLFLSKNIVFIAKTLSS